MIQPPFPSTIRAQLRHVTFLTTKTAVRKIRKTTVRRGPVLGQASACARGLGEGGGGLPLVGHQQSSQIQQHHYQKTIAIRTFLVPPLMFHKQNSAQLD